MARIRIGFASQFMSNHVVAKLNRGLYEYLDRERFEVFLLHLHDPGEPEISSDIADTVMVSVPCLSLDEARCRIAELRLDILVYADIGMGMRSYLLAFSRLAPVQCVLSGHPVTSGVPAIDYYLSYDVFEPPDADDHYTERLIRLQGPEYLYRPQVQPVSLRETYGFADDEHLYGCPVTLFKLHFEFDAVLHRLLRQDPKGRLVMFADQDDVTVADWQARFLEPAPDLAGRLAFLPRLSLSKFCGALQELDAVLDPFHFGLHSTMYAAMAAGAPVVTLPTPSMRGLIAAGCYKVLEIEELIVTDVEDYLMTAQRLATDKPWRQALSDRIVERCGVFFENPAGVRELEAFWLQALEAARTGRPAITWP